MEKGQVKDFLSDEEMQKLSPAKASNEPPDFISDDDMDHVQKSSSTSAEPSLKKRILDYQLPFGGSGRGLIKGTAEALPMAGIIGGGLIGTAAGMGIGSVPGEIVGAGFGGALGSAGKNAIENLILDEPKAKKDIYLDPAKGAIDGIASELGAKAIAKGVGAIANSPVGKWAVDKAGGALSKVGELFTGVPQKEIETYAKNADEIKKMAKASDNDTFQAAEQLREKWAGQVKSTRQELNKQISNALSSSDKSIDINPIVDSLKSSKSSINETLYPEQAAQIDDIVSKITALSKEGKVSASQAHEIKQFLQDKASSAYRPGAVFPLGTEAAKAAKGGAAVSRSLINDAEPMVAEANSKLANLHDIEDSMNMNMIREGKPESSILSAGSGGNPRNAKALSDLGEATDSNMLGDAEKLSAMRTFGSPKLMAADHTGKAAGRMGLAAGLGFLAGHAPGAVIASGLTSPAALKVAIDTGKLTAKMLREPMVQNALGQGLLKAAKGYMDTGNEELLQDSDFKQQRLSDDPSQGLLKKRTASKKEE